MAVDYVSPAALALLECTRTALEAHERPVARAFFAPGLDVAWDDCCDGQLWVRVVEQYPTSRFPSRDMSPGCNPALWAVTLAVGVVRCTPTVDDNATPPNPEALTESAVGISADSAILLEAIRCCFPGAAPFAAPLLVGNWNPLGPQGGCAGGEWRLTFGYPNCACPPQ